jgi:hypothetical protein
MSYEKDKLDSFVTSASLSTALASYVTSASVAAAIGAIDLSAYVSSNSLSAAVETDVLTVRGAASVSATLSAGAVTVAGHPVASVLIGRQIKNNATSIEFSGSWSDFYALELRVHLIAGGGTMPVSIFTDGGGTPVLTLPQQASVTIGHRYAIACNVIGTNGAAQKFIDMLGRTDGNVYFNALSATANTGFINCLRMSITLTASYVVTSLYGWRQA